MRKKPKGSQPLEGGDLLYAINREMPPGFTIARMPDGMFRVTVVMGMAPDKLRSCGGTDRQPLNYWLACELSNLIPPSKDPTMLGMRLAGALGMLQEMAPADGVEGMLCVQAIALHVMGIETARRSGLDGQPAEIAKGMRKDAANLLRAQTDMLAALDRKRGKGQQHIRVEKVLVTEGGSVIGRAELPAVMAVATLPAAAGTAPAEFAPARLVAVDGGRG